MNFHRGFCAGVRLHLDAVFRAASPANRLSPRTPAESRVRAPCGDMPPVFGLVQPSQTETGLLPPAARGSEFTATARRWPLRFLRVAASQLPAPTQVQYITWHGWTCDRQPFIHLFPQDYPRFYRRKRCRIRVLFHDMITSNLLRVTNLSCFIFVFVFLIKIAWIFSCLCIAVTLAVSGGKLLRWKAWHVAAMETKQEPSAVWSQTVNNDSSNGTQVRRLVWTAAAESSALKGLFNGDHLSMFSLWSAGALLAAKS